MSDSWLTAGEFEPWIKGLYLFFGAVTVFVLAVLVAHPSPFSGLYLLFVAGIMTLRGPGDGGRG